MRKLGPVAIALSGLTLAACGGDESLKLETAPLPTAPDDTSAQTFSREGYSFSHPQGWEWAGESLPSTLPGASEVSHVQLSPGTGSERLRVTVSRVPAMIENGQWDEGVTNREDYLNEVAQVPRGVTAENLDEFAEWRVPEFMEAYEPGDVREGPYATTVDRLPALHLVAEGTDLQGDPLVSQSVLVFDGETEYMIDCEYSPAKEEDIARAARKSSTPSELTEEEVTDRAP
jgi:hypothetical protein